MRSDDPIGRLPHRAPFLFVTRVDALAPGERVEAAWSVRGDEDFFAGHFPGDPIVPGVLIAEALAQAAGLAAAETENEGGRLAHVNLKMRSSVRPPAEVRLEATVERTIGSLWLFAARASCDGTEVASGTLTLAIGDGDPS